MLWIAGVAHAQMAAFVLVPYGEPNNKDPHAVAITQSLAEALQKENVTVKVIPPIDHLAAVSTASQICRDNGAAALLIPEGRYEQTEKMVNAVLATVYTYPTHVELRLDQIDCAQRIVWTATATSDITRSSGIVNAGNVGATIDEAFRNAVAKVVAQFSSAPRVVTAENPPSPAASALVAAPYLLVPFGQPGIADPRSPDFTRSLAKLLTDRKIAVKVGTPVDRLSVPSTAGRLCTTNGTGGILIPDVRLEQVQFRRTYGDLRLDLLSCDGKVVATTLGSSDLAVGFMNMNPGSVMTAVTEKAMVPALNQLTPTLSAAPTVPQERSSP